MPGPKAVTVDLEAEIMRVLEAALPGTQIYFLTHLRDNLVKVARDYLEKGEQDAWT